MKGKRLTDQQKELIESYRLIKNVREISELVGCSHITVRQRFNKQGMVYMATKGTLTEGSQMQCNTYINVEDEYRPKNLTKGYIKHINQPIN